MHRSKESLKEKAWRAQQESELEVLEWEFDQKLQTQEEAWRVELARKDVELQQKGLTVPFDPIDEMALDMEGLPWPDLMVQSDPIDVLTENVELLSVSRSG
ncbi:hypothetical protein AAFF_G00161000 [Aldrovandia affinis]|uniref:Uncharacterized protein n=1 Tax=Aldrovandia affinis TaxID=143900 RepID=A0AAD7RMK1_9TELE|nr:hypothetical protein AAFF_G00161000 [Aldrovandia affinis]